MFLTKNLFFLKRILLSFKYKNIFTLKCLLANLL